MLIQYSERIYIQDPRCEISINQRENNKKGSNILKELNSMILTYIKINFNLEKKLILLSYTCLCKSLLHRV